MDKPKNEKEFLVWLSYSLKHEINDKYRFYYDTVIKQLKTDFESSPFWKRTLSELSEMNDKYLLKKGVHLLIPSNTPQIFTKSLDSVITKAFRKNILNNENFPDAPKKGWITPDNWFEKINDIIRTTITVKYLDGVSFILDELVIIAKENSLLFNSSFEAREEGYYAAHSGVVCKFSIPNMSFEPTEKDINVEIQVTTQIQEIIKTLLHKHYEEKRMCEKRKDYKWQWDHKSP